MRQETVQISFGCLLHDIGKLIYRAGGESGSHSKLGGAFIKKLLPEDKPVWDCVRYHHASELRSASLPDKSTAWIACVADNLSAAADRRELPEGEGGNFERYMPLQSVFIHMNGEHPNNAVAPYPQDRKLRLPEKSTTLNPEQYQAVVEKLAKRLPEIERSEEWLDSLLCLLEAETSMFPSSTYSGESPDISLYDHLKTTAAIGACISDYLYAKGEKNFRQRLFDNEQKFRDEKAFILYSADFSGIQKFIYLVTSDKALKSLRSRSFFLELTMEHYIDELLSLCGMSRANLLYSGGGHCYILLPNTDSVKNSIETWNRRFNSWLSSEFGISLFLAHGYTECSGNELTNTPADKEPYKVMFRRVSAAISRHKLHRYGADDIRTLNRRANPQGLECKGCGRTEKLSGDRCEWCSLFAKLSDDIQTKNVYFVSRSATECDFTLPTHDGTAYITLTNEKTARIRIESGEAVIRVYSKNTPFTGLKYSTRLYVGDYAASNEMEKLAENSAGIKRIGICRMDVDNLGQAFVSGFERKDAPTAAQRQHFVTLSRTAAFSRQMSLFFKCYINDILSGGFGNRAELAVSIVYSGGDDVFLVGAWNDTIEAALRIQEAFARFCCGALTISAGIDIEDERFPIRLSAAKAGALEGRAKREPGKNSIALFDPELEHTYGWKRFGEDVMGEKLSQMREFFNAQDQVRGSSFIYRLLELLRLSQKEDGKLQLARYAYMLARLEPAKSSPAYSHYRKFSENMYRWALSPSDRQSLITAIYIYVYENRKGDSK